MWTERTDTGAMSKALLVFAKSDKGAEAQDILMCALEDAGMSSEEASEYVVLCLDSYD